MDFSLSQIPKVFRNLLVSFLFMQAGYHETSSLRLSPKCPVGNYFTDGCVSCWCDPGTGQSVCENMIACPRKNVKCPMGRKYQDECANDCTCYESTGAIFCKEKGPCNSIKRRNTYQTPPPAPPNRMDYAMKHESENKHALNHEYEHDSFNIPNSVPIHKQDLIIEPALIIRRKSFKAGDKEEQKKHPTTLLYLYEKQLKSMKEFKTYYNHYLDSQHEEVATSTMRDVPHGNNPHQNQEPSLFSASSNMKSKYEQPQQIMHMNLDSVPSNQLEIEIPLKNFKVASSSSRPPQDFHYIFKNMKGNGNMQGDRTKHNEHYINFRMASSTTGQPLELESSPNFATYHKHNLSLVQKAVQEYPPPETYYFTTPRPQTPTPKLESNYPTATVYNVVSSTMRPDLHDGFNFNLMTNASNSRRHNFYTAFKSRPQFISYITPSSFTTSRPGPITPRPSYKPIDQNNSASNDRHTIHAELNKPIFVNHIVATRRFPEIYSSHKNYNIQNQYPLPQSPPPTHRPKQYRLFLKSLDKRPHFSSDRNRVPLFVDKIAREFFRKPAIFVPKIKTVQGKQELELSRVVYNHKEMIPKKLVLEPGGLPLKVKFTPEAERDMNREWLNALKLKELTKLEQSLGYQPVQSLNNDYGHYHQPQQHQTHTHHHHYTLDSDSKNHYQQPHNQIYPTRYQQPTLQHHSNSIFPTQDTQAVYQTHPIQYPTQNEVPHYSLGASGNFEPHPFTENIGVVPTHEPLPIPDPVPMPPYAEMQDVPISGYTESPTFRPGPPYDDKGDITSSYPSPETPMDYPVIEQPPISTYEEYERPQQSDKVAIIEHTSANDNSYYNSHLHHSYPPSHHPQTVTEPETDSVSPRPDFTDPSFQIPSDAMDDFGFAGPSGYFTDMLPQASDSGSESGHEGLLHDTGTLLIDSFKKSIEIEQTTKPRPRIRIQDVLAHKRGQNHIHIKPELDSIFSSSTPIPTTTTNAPSPSPSPPTRPTTEEFNPEAILREIIDNDPDIGPNAILFKEDGETIPPTSTTTSTTTTSSSPTSNFPIIKSKGDIGVLPQDFDPEPQIFLTSTTPPNPDRSLNVDPLSFEQFYKDLFRPQKKREEVPVKPDAIVDADGVAKIFHYDSIIKTFTTGDSEEGNRHFDKRAHANKANTNNDKHAKTKGSNRKTNVKENVIPESKSIITTTMPTVTITQPKDGILSKSSNDDPNSSFKRELDWKSKLMADICTVNPDSALCFTYKSLCMLMSS